MGIFDRWLGQRNKAASTEEQMTLNQLLSWLGVHDVSGGALAEATYYACLKVLSEGIGKLPHFRWCGFLLPIHHSSCLCVAPPHLICQLCHASAAKLHKIL